ncbi:MAG: short chain dehydrogenase [Candidatus Viridilinea halotolerans]|uniref:Short chain dehydrogenase n=1 Tax=Candidatus Viridilinea halotolerans TaxID=2491704 RepID=A0A426TWK5_9CHLR|nr:MAG: short chain dehydrogenase [Candidatus Viridilinea halotolerans]
MANHLFLPLISPMLAAALALIFTRTKTRNVARGIVLTSVVFNLAYSLWLVWTVATTGIQVTQAAGWEAPFGITLVADGASALMLCVATLLMLVTMSYSFASLDPGYENFFYYPLLLLLLLGVSGAFLTGDIFNLYVWFEVLLLASFGLMTLGGSRAQLEGGLKYVVLNLLGSTAFLMACGLLYGTVGSLNMAHVAERMQSVNNPGIVTVIACLFFFAYGGKAAILPLFFWLPTSYHTPPVAVTAIFSGLLTKVGAYSLYRVLGLVLQDELVRLAPFVLVIAGLTMVVGVFGAMAQMNVRRILSFHIISQIGYTIMGLGLASAVGLAAGLLFTVHVMIVKTALFFIGGAAEQIYGTGDLKKMGGLAQREPLLAIFWFLGILSLAGIPPMSGFFGKLALLQAGVNQGAIGISVIAAFTGILTFFSMLKIWNEVFWKKSYGDMSKLPRVTPGLLLPGALLVMISLALGLGAGVLVDYSQMAGMQLFDRAGYIASVCGVQGCEAIVEAALR